MRILVDGVPGAEVDPLDRGLHYGDGLFETIAWRRGQPRFAQYHFERLAAGCARLGLPMPSEARLREDLAQAAAGQEATIKLILTRGSGPRGYRPPAGAVPRRIVMAFDAPAGAAPGPWQARLCATRLGRNPALAGLKHLGRLEQVLARAEWDDPGIHEGLMRDDLGRVVCGTQSNLFAVAGGRLLTPRLDECGVAGVMRRAVLRWAGEHGLAVAEVHLDAAQLFTADELFVTNALLGARALAALDGRPLGRGTLHEDFMAWLDAR